ncbi:ROK family protein [Streptomyces sp. MN03-5084-2B]|nr:ROK family protein [Streptomyces sp. MN03-5084-2B]
MDVGGTKVALRVEGGSGPREETFRWPAAGSAADDLALLGARAEALLATRPAPAAAVGVAMPALCDASGVVTTWPGRPGWAGLDLAAALRSVFGATPVALADDGDLAALAEARAADCPDVLYLGVGTGIGGGIVLGGRLWPGRPGSSCEVGHVVVGMAGPRCDCGRAGCVQAYASGPATLRRAARARGREVPFAELAEAAGAGTPWALDVLRESAAALAAVATGVSELVQPALLVLGGGFAAGTPALAGLVAEELERTSRTGRPALPVRGAVLGGLSSLHGALLLARERAVPD